MSNSGSGNDDAMDARMARLQAICAAIEILQRNEQTAGWLFANMRLKGSQLAMATANYLTLVEAMQRERDALVKEIAAETMASDPLIQRYL